MKAKTKTFAQRNLTRLYLLQGFLELSVLLFILSINLPNGCPSGCHAAGPHTSHLF